MIMRFSTHVRSISYLKANGAEGLARVGEDREPLVITHNGEAKAVLRDIASYEQSQETMALLKLLALGQQDIEAGRAAPIDEAAQRIGARHGIATPPSCAPRTASRRS